MSTDFRTQPNEKTDEEWRKELWEKNWRDLVSEWILTDNEARLNTILEKFAAELERMRGEPPKSKYSAHHAIYLSVGVFVALMAGLLVAPIEETAATELFKGFFEKAPGGNTIQFALIMSASGGMIPGIAYVIVRDVEKQRKNEELESISLSMRQVRSKILSLKEDAAARDLRRRG